MPKGDKYSCLTFYLIQKNTDSIQISFKELEKIMGVNIPKSVFKYKTFGSMFNHSFSYGWSIADYKAKANFDSKFVIFSKINSEK
jgi:hypothetical protein